MFEIIMLLAFLWAASSQLIPHDQAESKASLKKSGRAKRVKSLPLQQPSEKSGKKSIKAKNRSHNYAYAA
jgi:hypothetical protein